MKKYKNYFFLSVFFLLLAKPAYADAGLPMIFVTLPCMAIGLIPIIFVEACVFVKKLKQSFKQAIKISAIVNIVSTIVGTPLTWLLLVLIQLLTGGGTAHGFQTPLQKFLAVTWQAPWLIPYESDLNWMIPSAALVLLIPFFFVSCFIEYNIAKTILRQIDRDALKKGVFTANLISYSILFVLALIWLITAVAKKPL